MTPVGFKHDVAMAAPGTEELDADAQVDRRGYC
jgi:hypothetical protein